MVVILIITYTYICVQLGVVSSSCYEPPLYRPTDDWEGLFIGKCLLYKNDYGSSVLCNRDINCTSLWYKVKSAVAFQPKCNFPVDRYEGFLTESAHFVPEHKFLFWENVYSLVMRYSNKGKNFYTISDTLTGYLFDNVVWCGNSTEPDGIEKYPSTCPGYKLTDGCNSSAQSALWATASQHYARRAYGVIQVMMNASITPTYTDNTYFGRYELPNINATKVQKAAILMVHYLGDPVRETCSSDSILKLKSRLEAKGIKPYCKDNPRDVMFLLCSENPEHPECKPLTSSAMTNYYKDIFIYIMLLFYCLS